MRPAPVIVDLYINSGKRPELSAGVEGTVPICRGFCINAGQELKYPGDQETGEPQVPAM